MGNTETDHVKVAQSDEKTGTAAAKIVFTLAEADLGDVQGKVAARGSGAFYPSTHQERLQEFVDGFGRIGKAYNDAVHPDEGRFTKFQDRMMNVYNFDRETFLDLAKLGTKLSLKSTTPEAVGTALGDAFIKTLERQSTVAAIDLQGPDWMNLQGAVSGMMLAARANFDRDPARYKQQTIEMVDAMEKVLEKKVPGLHAIIWSDTGEPGMASGPPDMFKTRDRHSFQQ